MAQCSNCYNNCVEITSDKCVKYTGVNVPVLDIKTGDSLSWVEQALITFLTATINGTGIQITIDENDYCELVTQYLPTCETITALDLFKALVKASCDLQAQIDAEKARIDAIEANYSVDCLEGIAPEDGTHTILQAVITKLCEVDTTLTALALDVDANYVKLSDLDSLIAAYIAGTETSTRYSSRMVPYVAMEYYGPITGFDATGAGIVDTIWEDIYLCNGDNGTPDKRGRVAVGATSTPGVIAMDSAVDPGVAGNPAYTLSDTAHGINIITLDATQIPSHTHTATVVDPGHTHEAYAGGDFAIWENNEANAGSGSSGFEVNQTNHHPTTASSGVDGTGISVSNSSTGGGLSHNNYQPGIGAYYIIYIP